MTSEVDLLDLLRQAMDDTGWNQTALASEMHKDEGYVSKVLSEDKPLGRAFLQALPTDVAARFAARYAEAFGLIVVAPMRGDDALKAFVGGFLGLLVPSPALPARSSGLVKAEAPARVKRTA